MLKNDKCNDLNEARINHSDANFILFSEITDGIYISMNDISFIFRMSV